jgi:hypothetical protein
MKSGYQLSVRAKPARYQPSATRLRRVPGYPKQGRRGLRPRLSGTARTRGALVALGLLVVMTTAAACNRDEARAEPAASNAVVVGPENIAVVRLQDVRTGPSLSGSLQPEQEATVRAEVQGAVVQ